MASFSGSGFSGGWDPRPKCTECSAPLLHLGQQGIPWKAPTDASIETCGTCGIPLLGACAAPGQMGGTRGGAGRGGGASSSRQGCRVSRCTESHSRHYCSKCKSKDSDHFSSQCGGKGGGRRRRHHATTTSSSSTAAASMAAKIRSDPYFQDALSGKHDFMSPQTLSCGHLCAGFPGEIQCCACRYCSSSCSKCIGRSQARQAHHMYGPRQAQFMQQVFVTLTGVDGSRVQMTSTQVSDRQTRLGRGGKRIFFHQTGDAVEPIVKSDMLKVGSTGIAGGGIYLAVAKDHTMHKAHYFGFLFKVEARLGQVQRWSSTQIDCTMSFAKLTKDGYDSVLIPRPGGDEHIVYHSDQVKLLEVCRIFVPPHHQKHDHATAEIAGQWISVRLLQQDARALAEFVADPESRDRSVVQRHVDETLQLLGKGGSRSSTGGGGSRSSRGSRGSRGRWSGTGGSSGGGSGSRQGCRVSGCTEDHSRHYCRRCKSKDSDHFSSDCR